MQLDPPSMLIALLATHVLYTLLLLGMWLRRRTNDALALWALANALGMVSTWCMSLRGSAPYSVTVTLANTAMIAAWMLIWGGMRRFSQRRLLLWPMLVLPLLVGAVLQWVPDLRADYPSRVIIVGIMWSAGILLTVVECARAERHERIDIRRALMAAFVALACFVAVRAWITAGMPPDQDKLLAGRLAGLNFFINMLIGSTWNIGLVMMWNEQLEKHLKRVADNDGLTNILNRRGFQDMGQRIMQRARRDSLPVSVLLMDLDYFKRINDQHGHDAGDRMLCAFADLARRAIRPSDLLARYGGEEFCALLPRTAAPEATAIAERLRQDFLSATVLVGDTPVATTVSVGVAEIEAGETLHQALSRADAALYLAKRKGRNRVEPQSAGVP